MVSGLPGSGKSTVGRALAEHLALPVIDKDVILEALYDSLGIGDQDWRGRLSRAGDEVLFALAAQAGRAVLDNSARPPACALSAAAWSKCSVTAIPHWPPSASSHAPATPGTWIHSFPPIRSPPGWPRCAPPIPARCDWAAHY